MTKSTTVFEHDVLAPEQPDSSAAAKIRAVPRDVFDWLEQQALIATESSEQARWAQLIQSNGRRAVKVLNYVGVVQAPDGFQIEILPKTGKAADGDGEVAATRTLLIEMLRCLGEFRHIRADSAKLSAAKMPLLEVFIREFLRSVEHIVKRGLRGDYVVQEDNLFALRGKLLVAQHLRHNLFRPDRFFSQHDEFTNDRPVNRLLHSALQTVLTWTRLHENQKLARELAFVFSDIPLSDQPEIDFQRVRFDRGMGHYEEALAWARLILRNESPLTGLGEQQAPSLLFPMEQVFEAYVAKHLRRQMTRGSSLKIQVGGNCLVRHRGQDWFRMKPDMLATREGENRLLLDTKWKLIDGRKSSISKKYGLSQADFYQLHAYGQSYLHGNGDLALIYPRTGAFDQPLEVFQFHNAENLRLWILPFCLKSKILLAPANEPVFQELFENPPTFARVLTAAAIVAM